MPDPVKPDDKLLLQIPAVRAFVVRYPTASAQSITDFYDRFEEAERVWSTVQAKAKEGDAAAVQKTIEFSPSAMVRLTGIRDMLNEHAQIVHMVHLNPTMTPGDKRQLIDTMYFRMIELARAGSAAAREAKKTLTKDGAHEATPVPGAPGPADGPAREPPMKIKLTPQTAGKSGAVVLR